MRNRKLVLAVSLLASIAPWQPTNAAGDLSRQEPIEVRVDLGGAGSDAHMFQPSELTFETGKLYRLVLHNPSEHEHYFTSHGFAERIYTRKVQVVSAPEQGDTISEIKGSIREIEVYPGGTAEWWFVPVATGSIDDLHCHVKDEDGLTHAEKGMTGVIVIE